MPRILYAIQGCGNGHLARALDLVPRLQRLASHLDVLVSGPSDNLPLPFPVSYQLPGLSYITNHRGGISYRDTLRGLRPAKFVRDVWALPVAGYDLVISDFEPVTAWACRRQGVPCVSLSHQSGVLSPQAPRPQNDDWISRNVLHKYAPATAHYGFHFQRYAPNVFLPVIRQQVRALTPDNDGHYTVYLPSYDEPTLIKRLRYLDHRTRWEVFSKGCQRPTTYGNVQVQPVSSSAFTQSMARSAGVLCGAGFETPAEALFLGKKLLVIPMRKQYEQACNAAALAEMGVPVAEGLNDPHLTLLDQWLHRDQPILVHYPDDTDAILRQVLREQLAPASALATPSSSARSPNRALPDWARPVQNLN